MFGGAVFSAEMAAVAVGALTAWMGEQYQALRQWLRYRPERHYMRGASAA